MGRFLLAVGSLVALAALSGCSLEDAPLVGKPAASMDGHTISMSDYRLRLKVEQDLYTNTRTESQKEDLAIRSLVDEQLLASEAASNAMTETLSSAMAVAATAPPKSVVTASWIRLSNATTGTTSQPTSARTTA